MSATIELAVGIAHRYPPLIDEFRNYVVQAPTLNEARLIATQMAIRGGIIPLWVGFPEDVADLPDEWVRDDSTEACPSVG